MRSRTCFAPLGAVILASLSGCASDEGQWRADLDRMAEQHERYAQELRDIQAELALETPTPDERDFGEDGTILLWECFLGGRPGREYLRIHYTFLNTTEHTFEAANVTLTLYHAESGAEWSEVQRLTIPYKYAFTPNSSYTTSLEIPTRGIHRRPGWQWELGLEAVPAR